MNNDARLITETLAGDTSAFGQLVSRYQDRLYNTLVHMTGAPEEARDVAQEAFVQAFTKLETFQGSSGFYTWLYRIAFNLSVSRRRRKKPTVSIQQIHDNSGEEPIDQGDAPGSRLERLELADQVQAGLHSLREEHRTMLVLREIDGRSYEEISEMLALPIGTVRSRLHRARLQLRDQLKQVLQADH